jgi:hypothetical protein
MAAGSLQANQPCSRTWPATFQKSAAVLFTGSRRAVEGDMVLKGRGDLLEQRRTNTFQFDGLDYANFAPPSTNNLCNDDSRC